MLSKVQLDERAKLFAALLIEEWTANPANVRLLRVALDMYPDPQFLEEVLRVLNPGWAPDGSRGARREIRLYCLAELFRAGAIETGMVSDDECLPQGIDVDRYHQRLLGEAQRHLQPVRERPIGQLSSAMVPHAAGVSLSCSARRVSGNV